MSESLSNLRNRFNPSSLETKRSPAPTEGADGKDRLLTASPAALMALETPPTQDAPRGGHADMVFDTKHGYARSTLDSDAHLRSMSQDNHLPVVIPPVGIPVAPPLRMAPVSDAWLDRNAIPLVGRMVAYGGLLGVAGGFPGLAIGIALAAGLDRIARDVAGGEGEPARAFLGSQATFMVGTFTLPLPPLVSDPDSRGAEVAVNMLAAEAATLSIVYLCTQLRRLL